MDGRAGRISVEVETVRTGEVPTRLVHGPGAIARLGGLVKELVDGPNAAIARSVQLGGPFDPETTLGPPNNEPTAQKMDRHVADALGRGAELVGGGARAEGSPTWLYYRPTVLGGVAEEMEVAREETFGPIVPITTIRDELGTLQAIDSSPYGLLAAVWTRDLARGLRFAESARAGWVTINASSNHWESRLPFGGGAGSRSGIGRVGGRYSMETFTEEDRDPEPGVEKYVQNWWDCVGEIFRASVTQKLFGTTGQEMVA